MRHGILEFVIVDSNRLSAMGLRQILQDIIPEAEITTVTSFDELTRLQPDHFVHYFVSSGIYFEHTAYFQEQRHRSIVLVQGDNYPRMAGLLTINVCQNEAALARDILALRHRGHPIQPPATVESVLSSRETEVAVLLSKGLINKEVADRLNISLATAISHRRNIMDKLHARSLADIIIYVVTQGLVSLEDLS